MNDYLRERNKNFYRGSTTIVHPLYDVELGNAIDNLKSYLNRSVLARARLLREQTLTKIAMEKCWKDTNFAYSESEMCHDSIFKLDSVLGNIENFNKEVEANIVAEYQNKINYFNEAIYSRNSVQAIGEPSKILNEKELEKTHRKFLLNVHLYQRFYFYHLANHLFINKLN